MGGNQMGMGQQAFQNPMMMQNNPLGVGNPNFN